MQPNGMVVCPINQLKLDLNPSLLRTLWLQKISNQINQGDLYFIVLLLGKQPCRSKGASAKNSMAETRKGSGKPGPPRRGLGPAGAWIHWISQDPSPHVVPAHFALGGSPQRPPNFPGSPSGLDVPNARAARPRLLHRRCDPSPSAVAAPTDFPLPLAYRACPMRAQLGPAPIVLVPPICRIGPAPSALGSRAPSQSTSHRPARPGHAQCGRSGLGPGSVRAAAGGRAGRIPAAGGGLGAGPGPGPGG